jgi:hypothetical protein
MKLLSKFFDLFRKKKTVPFDLRNEFIGFLKSPQFLFGVNLRDHYPDTDGYNYNKMLSSVTLEGDLTFEFVKYLRETNFIFYNGEDIKLLISEYIKNPDSFKGSPYVNEPSSFMNTTVKPDRYTDYPSTSYRASGGSSSSPIGAKRR